MSIRVSIILRVDASSFVEEAAQSVLAQTFRDWEMLLVPQGTTNVEPMARNIADRCPGRVRRLKNDGAESRGIRSAWNQALREASGDFVALLGSNGFWVPEKLQEQMAILDAHPEAAMVYGPTQLWWSWTGKIEDRPRDRLERLGVAAESIVAPPRLLHELLEHGVPLPRSDSVLMRREAVLAVGGFENSVADVNAAEKALFAKLCLAFPVYASGRCWTRNRQRSDSSDAAARASVEELSSRLQFLEWLERYSEGAGIGGIEIRNTLERQLAELRYRAASGHVRLVRSPARVVKSAIRASIPAPALRTLRRLRGFKDGAPPPGHVRFGDFRRLQPISRSWGYDRGLPIDRYYIETFLRSHSGDIRGRVMEIGDNEYTWRFGGEAVTRSDVLNVAGGDPKTTLVADLASGDHLPSGCFDCVIFTETLHLLYDFRAGLRTLYRILKPGGVLLATFPGITKIGRENDWGTTWYWSFTPLSARRIFEEVFAVGDLAFESWGNVLVSTACLWGLAANELRREELEHRDPEYPVTIAVRACRAEAASFG